MDGRSWLPTLGTKEVLRAGRRLGVASSTQLPGLHRRRESETVQCWTVGETAATAVKLALG